MNKYKPKVVTIQKNHQKNTEEVGFIQAGKIDDTGKQDDKLNGRKDSSHGTGGTKTNFKGKKACFHCSGDYQV